MRVLQSFPHRIGAARICTTAWHQAAGVARAGGRVTVAAGAVARPLPPAVCVRTTLARGAVRVPYKVLGDRAFELHDRLVARSLPRLAGQIDIVHVWPLAAAETLRVARDLGIPSVLERPNAHTRFAYEVVARESERLGVMLPRGHEHAFNRGRLAREEEEYELADGLLCPSEFVVKTFCEQGFTREALVRHIYGYDPSLYHPAIAAPKPRRGLQALFAGVCAVRKGLHFALQAWLESPASRHGRLRIAGGFVPGYRERLQDLLAHPSIEVLGHRDDVPALMRESDVLVLPSIEEGFGLVCVEAMACGCVPLVSDACTEVCAESEAGLVHEVGDVDALTRQMTMLAENRSSLARLRERCLAAAPQYTWSQAGVRLLAAYREVISKTLDQPAAVRRVSRSRVPSSGERADSERRSSSRAPSCPSAPVPASGAARLRRRLNKPYYVFRPGQVVRRVALAAGAYGRAGEYVQVQLPWGHPLRVRTEDKIGVCLARRGVFDLAVCEALWRLADDGELALDVGANIGQMTSVLARAVGARGRVMAFEPHPDVFFELSGNAGRWLEADDTATIELHNCAASSCTGRAELCMAHTFRGNRGTASLAPGARAYARLAAVPVRVVRLDEAVGEERVGVMKLDVEGHELEVLRGATRLLADHRIRDIVFEEIRQPPTPVTRLLEGCGYSIFSLDQALLGPVAAPVGQRRTLQSTEDPSYLGTLEPARALERLRGRGWATLGIANARRLHAVGCRARHQLRARRAR